MTGTFPRAPRTVRPAGPRRLAALASALLLLLAPAGAGAAYRAPAFSAGGMVVTSQADATRAGVAMLEAGGNAVDAAVAAAFALSVTQPFSSGLGGGAFLLIRTPAGEVFALDARETAPAAAHRTMYLEPGVPEDASLVGALAVGTPGLVAGLVLAARRFGTLPLPVLMEPAIRLAEEGFEIGPYHARMLARMRERLSAERFPETVRIQFPPPGVEPRPGWRLVQRDLGRTLRAIAAEGADAFYRGPVARAIAEEVRRRGGILTEEDLASYRPVWREPVRGSYRGFEIVSFPPPSSGGVILIEILHILEHFDVAGRPPGSSRGLHLVSEAMKLAFADRAAWLGDPDFVDVPVAGLVSKAYAARLARRINPPWYRRAPWNWFRREVAIRVEGPGEPPRDAGTTHLSVTDARGGAVAITKTINTPFGSGITVPGTGVVLNNEMDDFSVAPGRPNVYGLVDTRGANAIEPGKRPLSSMTPTFVLRDGALRMVTGSPGGPRIISTTLLSILNRIDYGMDVQAAVSAPRFHHQWIPDRIVVEPEVPEDVVLGLRRRGHRVEVSPRHWSACEAIAIDPDTGLHLGGSDPRRDGLALGPRRAVAGSAAGP